MAKAGEVKSQHRQAFSGQLAGDLARREDVLGAGKAMREQGCGADIACRQIKSRRELVALCACERDFLDRFFGFQVNLPRMR